jgi:hypothetical protein
MDADRPFTLILSKLATVNDARREVAAFLEAPSGDYITLLVKVRPLNGSSVLTRLHLSDEISAYVRDIHPVRLLNRN